MRVCELRRVNKGAKGASFVRAWYYSPLARCVTKSVLSQLGRIHDCVLDVGCGFGKATVTIESSCNYVVGIDIQNNFDRSKISPRLDYCLADAFRLPFRDGCIDGSISVDVIEHVRECLGFLVELKRVIKKGGLLILATPNRNRLSNQLKTTLRKPVKYPLCLGTDPIIGECLHIREFSKNDLTQLLSGAGFVGIEVRGVWLGIPFKRIEVGLTSFPAFFERYSQYWVAKAVNPI